MAVEGENLSTLKSVGNGQAYRRFIKVSVGLYLETVVNLPMLKSVRAYRRFKNASAGLRYLLMLTPSVGRKGLGQLYFTKVRG